MAAARVKDRLVPLSIDLLAMSGKPGKPVAFMYGLPLQAREALAYMAFSAGTAEPSDIAILRSWVVAMTLAHGSWVQDEVPELLGLKQAGDVSQG